MQLNVKNPILSGTPFTKINTRRKKAQTLNKRTNIEIITRERSEKRRREKEREEREASYRSNHMGLDQASADNMLKGDEKEGTNHESGIERIERIEGATEGTQMPS